MCAHELGTQGRARAEVCQPIICVKALHPPNHPLNKSEGWRKREEDANPYAIPGSGQTWGRMGRRKHWEVIHFSWDGSKANIPFFMWMEASEETKVCNHFQGHWRFILNVEHLCFQPVSFRIRTTEEGEVISQLKGLWFWRMLKNKIFSPPLDRKLQKDVSSFTIIYNIKKTNFWSFFLFLVFLFFASRISTVRLPQPAGSSFSDCNTKQQLK